MTDYWNPNINLENVKAGDIFWESCQQGNMQMKALQDAVIEDDYVSVLVLTANNREIKVGYKLTNNPYKGGYYTEPMYIGVKTTAFNDPQKEVLDNKEKV